MALPSRRSRSEAPAPLETLVAEHVGWLEAAHYSTSTVRSRRRNLRHFAAWGAERGLTSPGELTLPILERTATRSFTPARRTANRSASATRCRSCSR